MTPKRIAGLVIAALLLTTIFIANPVLADKDHDDSETKCLKIIDSTTIISLALRYIEDRFGKGNYTLMKIELEDSKYELKFLSKTQVIELKINACSGEIIEIALETITEPIDKINLNQTEVINAVISFLKSKFGDANYTVLEIELEKAIYEIKVTDGLNIYEIKVNSKDGSIIGYEIKKLQLKLEEKEFEKDFNFIAMRKDKEEGLMVKTEKQNTVLEVHYLSKEIGNQTKLNLILKMDELIEFIDNGNVAGSLDNKDKIVSFINLHSLKWNTTFIQKTLPYSNETVEILVIQSAKLPNDGKITFVYHITPTVRDILTQSLQARIYEVKFDIKIENYPWRANDSSLALRTSLNAEFKYKDSAGMKIEFEGLNNIKPFFSWGGTALADGNTIQVNSSLEDSKLYIIYPHFLRSLEHDPSIGYQIYNSEFVTTNSQTKTYKTQAPVTTTTLASILKDLTLVIIFIILITVVFSILIYRSRKNKQDN